MKSKFPYRYWVLIFLFSLISITYLDRISIALLNSRIMDEFHLTNTQWGWVVGAFALAYAVFEIPSGMLGDIKGQRATLMRIVIWWSFFTALTGVAIGLSSLIFARFLFGVGEAGAFPNSSAVISRWFPASESSLGVSSTMAGICCGVALAPLIVGPIADAFGWRTTFFVNGAIGLIWVAVCFYWFRNNPSEMSGISRDEVEFIETHRTIASHSEHISWRNIVKSRNLLILSLSYFCTQWNIYFLITWLPRFLQKGRHFSEHNMMLTTSLVFTPAIITSFLGGVFCDWLIKKKGLRFGRRFVGASSAAVMSLLLLIVATTSNNTIMIPCLIINMVLMMIYAFNAFGVCVNISGRHTGRIAGIMNFFGQTGAFFMATMFGIIVDHTHNNYNAPIIIIAVAMLVGSLLFLFVDASKKLVFEGEELSKQSAVLVS